MEQNNQEFGIMLRSDNTKSDNNTFIEHVIDANLGPVIISFKNYNREKQALVFEVPVSSSNITPSVSELFNIDTKVYYKYNGDEKDYALDQTILNQLCIYMTIEFNKSLIRSRGIPKENIVELKHLLQIAIMYYEDEIGITYPTDMILSVLRDYDLILKKHNIDYKLCIDLDYGFVFALSNVDTYSDEYREVERGILKEVTSKYHSIISKHFAKEVMFMGAEECNDIGITTVNGFNGDLQSDGFPVWVEEKYSKVISKFRRKIC